MLQKGSPRTCKPQTTYVTTMSGLNFTGSFTALFDLPSWPGTWLSPILLQISSSSFLVTVGIDFTFRGCWKVSVPPFSEGITPRWFSTKSTWSEKMIGLPLTNEVPRYVRLTVEPAMTLWLSLVVLRVPVLRISKTFSFQCVIQRCCPESSERYSFNEVGTGDRSIPNQRKKPREFLGMKQVRRLERKRFDLCLSCVIISNNTSDIIFKLLLAIMAFIVICVGLGCPLSWMKIQCFFSPWLGSCKLIARA